MWFSSFSLIKENYGFIAILKTALEWYFIKVFFLLVTGWLTVVWGTRKIWIWQAVLCWAKSSVREWEETADRCCCKTWAWGDNWVEIQWENKIPLIYIDRHKKNQICRDFSINAYSHFQRMAATLILERNSTTVCANFVRRLLHIQWPNKRLGYWNTNTNIFTSQRWWRMEKYS